MTTSEARVRRPASQVGDLSAELSAGSLRPIRFRGGHPVGLTGPETEGGIGGWPRQLALAYFIEREVEARQIRCAGRLGPTDDRTWTGKG
jgi:hypothetical protein